MKKIITCLAAGLLVLGTQSLMAQSTTNSVPPVKQHQTLTPEQRKEQHLAVLKILGLTQAEFKALTPAERQAKMKDALAALQAKKASGTLTEQDQKDLALLQSMVGHGHKKAPAPSGT